MSKNCQTHFKNLAAFARALFFKVLEKYRQFRYTGLLHSIKVVDLVAKSMSHLTYTA